MFHEIAILVAPVDGTVNTVVNRHGVAFQASYLRSASLVSVAPIPIVANNRNIDALTGLPVAGVFGARGTVITVLVRVMALSGSIIAPVGSARIAVIANHICVHALSSFRVAKVYGAKPAIVAHLLLVHALDGIRVTYVDCTCISVVAN